MLRVNIISIIVFLILALTWTSPARADKNGGAIGKNNLEETVLSLIENDVSTPLIINKLQKQGFDDDEIVGALLKTKLSPEEIVFYVFQGHASYNNILEAFEKNGYDKIEILQLLASVGVNKDIFFRAGRYFKIPRATLVAIYQEAKERPAKFGRVAAIQSVAGQPALIAIGISRITAGDAFLKHPRKRISTCRWVCEWVCE